MAILPLLPMLCIFENLEWLCNCNFLEIFCEVTCSRIFHAEDVCVTVSLETELDIKGIKGNPPERYLPVDVSVSCR